MCCGWHKHNDVTDQKWHFMCNHTKLEIGGFIQFLAPEGERPAYHITAHDGSSEHLNQENC
jgi:hypothetical protein